MKKTTAILGIAAPASWILVPLLGYLCSRGPDGGWSGMAAMFFGLALVLLTHIAGLIGLVTIVVLKKKRNESLGKGLIFSLSYYVLITGILLLAMGPRELWNDSSALLRGLIRKG